MAAIQVMCPLCDEPARSKSKWLTKDGVTRRYVCRNNHRFNTQEKIVAKSIENVLQYEHEHTKL